jgi:hypothetical protein
MWQKETSRRRSAGTSVPTGRGGVCPRRPSPRSSESTGPTWEDWSEGKRNLTLRSLERIAEQMGVEVEELMR